MATKGKINVDFALRYVGAIGANRYVANVNRYSTIAYRDILQYAARAAHVPESAVDVAMEALYDALAYFVLNGHNVKIDGIGTFAFGVNAKAEINEADAGADSVHRLKILYLPEMDLRRDMNNVAISTSFSNPGNLAEDTGAALLSLYSIAYGTTKSNAKNISINATNYLPAGKCFLVLEGTALNKRIGIEVYGVTVLPVDGEDEVFPWGLQYKDTAPGIGEWRVSRGFGRSIFVFDVPANGVYLTSIEFKELDDEGFPIPGRSIKRYYSIPDTGIYAESAAEFALITGISMNGVAISDNMTMLPDYAGEFNMRVNGPNSRSVLNTIVVTGATLTAKTSSVSSTLYKVTPNEGATSFTVKANIEGVEKTYTILLGSSTQQVVISTISANGVSISNGSESTIVAGESYNFTLNGQNLGNLTVEDLHVPSGSTVRNFAKSANSISFTMDNAQNGDISVTYNGAEIFKVTLAYYDPETGDAAITSIGGVANNGTYHGESSQGKMTLSVKGTDLDKLTASSFTYSRSGYTFALTEGTATERVLTLNSNGNGFLGGTLRVMNGETTIFTLTIDNGGEVEF